MLIPVVCKMNDVFFIGLSYFSHSSKQGVLALQIITMAANQKGATAVELN